MKTINKVGDGRGIKKIYAGNDGMKYRKVSRWIQIKDIPVTEGHFLFDYAEEGVLECFRYGNSIYPINQIERISLVEIENANLDGSPAILTGSIPICNWGGIYTELDSAREHIRLWEMVTE